MSKIKNSAKTKHRRTRYRLFLLAVPLLAIALLIVALNQLTPAGTITPEAVTRLKRVSEFGSGDVDVPAISPDGSIAIFPGVRGLWWYDLTQPEQPPTLLDIEITYALRAVTFLPDGRQFAVVTYAEVELYDTATHTLVREFALPEKGYYTIIISPDGRSLTMHDSTYLVIIDLTSGETYYTLKIPRKPALTASPNLPMAVPVERVPATVSYGATTIAFSADSRLLLRQQVDSEGHLLRRWLFDFATHTLYTAKFSPDVMEAMPVIGGNFRPVKDPTGRMIMARWGGALIPPGKLPPDYDKGHLPYSQLGDNYFPPEQLELLRLPDPEIYRYQNRSANLNGKAPRFTPDGAHYFVGDSLASWKFYRAGQAEPIATLFGQKLTRATIQLAPDRQTVIIDAYPAHSIRQIYLWSLVDSHVVTIRNLAQFDSPPLQMPDGRFVVLNCAYRCQKRDLETGKILYKWDRDVSGKYQVDPSQRYFAVRIDQEERHRLEIYDLVSGELLRILPYMDDFVFTPDGDLLELTSKNVLIWRDGQTGAMLDRWIDSLPHAQYRIDRFSPDGTIVGIRFNDDDLDLPDEWWHLRLVNLQTGTMFESEGDVYNWDMTGDYRYLGFIDDTGLNARDIQHGFQPVLDIPPIDDDYFKTLAFSPDGRLLAAGTSAGILLLIDTQTWKVIHRVQAHIEYLYFAAFTPDGTRLLTRGIEDVIYVWELEGMPTTPDANPAIILPTLENDYIWLPTAVLYPPFATLEPTPTGGSPR